MGNYWTMSVIVKAPTQSKQATTVMWLTYSQARYESLTSLTRLVESEEEELYIKDS